MKNGSGNGNNGNGNGNGNGNHDEPFEFPDNLIIPETVDDFSSKDSGDRVFKSLLIKNELFDTDGSSDASTASFRKRPARYEHPLWSLGWTDGRLGQPLETNEALLVARGKLRRVTRLQAMKAKLSLNEAKLPDLQAQITRVRDLLTNAMSHYTSILTDRAGRFHEFSYGLGVFYMVVAVILFLSDIPLTLKLVAKGFELKTEETNAAGQIVFGLDDLLVYGPTVFLKLWEPLALALGIALAGVFLKLFLDDVIFRQAPEVRWKRTIALSIILGGFIFTMIVLGIFRSQIQDTVVQNELNKTRAQQEQVLRNGGHTESQILDLLGPRQVHKQNGIETATFIALTLALPLIAGACFSAGWRRFKDTQRYNQLKKEIKQLENNLDSASASFQSAVSEIESAKIWLELNADSSDADAETQQELNLYRHGYLRGVNVPETIDHGLPFYDRVQRSAQKILAKRLKERIWSDV